MGRDAPYLICKPNIPNATYSHMNGYLNTLIFRRYLIEK